MFRVEMGYSLKGPKCIAFLVHKVQPELANIIRWTKACVLSDQCINYRISFCFRLVSIVSERISAPLLRSASPCPLNGSRVYLLKPYTGVLSSEVNGHR